MTPTLDPPLPIDPLAGMILVPEVTFIDLLAVIDRGLSDVASSQTVACSVVQNTLLDCRLLVTEAIG